MVSHYRPVRGFRIADPLHPIFDGTGSYLNGGRWTSKGRRVINAAESYAGALLEMLVHLNLGRIPRTHAWIQITIPSDLPMEEVRAEDLPGWNAPDLRASQRYGDSWHSERRSAVLLVPALVTRGIDRNLLLNQDHPDFAAITANEPQDVNWDERLFQR